MRPTLNSLTKALLALALGFMMHAAAWAGPEAALLGDWTVKLNYQGNLIPAKITFSQDGGALKGVWSSERGDSVLANIQFDGAKITFSRSIKFQDQEFELQYEGKVDGGKLVGKFSTPMGDMEANGDRVGGAAVVATPAPVEAPKTSGAANPVGRWNVQVKESPLLGGELEVKEKDGKLSGSFNTQLGEQTLSSITIDGNHVTFKSIVDAGGMSIPLTFKGEIDGDKVVGMLGLAVEGKRLGAPAVAAAPAAAPAVASSGATGKWKLSIQSPDGAQYDGGFVVKEEGGKLVGTLTTELGEVKIPDIKRDGQNVSFATEIDFGGVMVPLKFKGVDDGATLKGTVSLNMQGQEMELPVDGTKEGAAVAAAPAGGFAAAGKWKLSIQSPDGAQYDGDFEVKDEAGKLSGVLTTELGQVKIAEIKAAGKELSFATEVDFGGVMVPLKFKGTGDGDTLKGAVTLNMQGQEMELPVDGKRSGAAAAAAPAPAAAPAAASGFKAAGKWKLAIQSPDGAQYDGDFEVKDEAGKVSGVLTTELGQVKIAEIKLNGKEVSFATEVDFGGVMVPLKFKGTGDGDTLKGAVTLNMQGQEMELPVDGKRDGAAAAAAPAPAAASGFKPAGSWKLSIQSPDGAQYDGDLEVKEEGGKVSGLLTTELGQVKIPELKLNGSEVSFATDVDFGGVMVPLKFKGTGAGDALKGTVSLNMEGQEMELPLEGKRTGAAAASATGGAAPALAGKWSLEVQTPDGATSMADLVVKENNGALSAVLSTEIGEGKIDSIKLEGGNIAFTAKTDFGGIEFKGMLAGEKLEGKAKMQLEGQDVELPIKGTKEKTVAAVPALAGKWSLEVQTPDGATSMADLVVKENNGTFSAVLTTELGEGKIDSVKLEGGNISFTAKADFGGVQVPIEFKGMLAGEKLEGKAKIQFEGQDMELPIKGTKDKSAAAAPKAEEKKTAEAAPCCKSGGACCPNGACCKAA